MPSEKQIEAAKKALGPIRDTYVDRDDIIKILTAAEQAEPTTADRTGAVKVKAVLELVQYHVTDDDDRATLATAISALEPAEPTVPDQTKEASDV